MINYLRVGKIISHHGIKGEVKIFPTTDDVKRFDSLKRFYISDSESADDSDISDTTYEVDGVKYVKDLPILKIKGLDKIEDIVPFIGKNIYVKRKDAVKLKLNEYFISDIIGLSTVYEGKKLGSIKDVMKTKANSILVIDAEKKEILVPFVYDFIEKIDENDKTIYLRNLEGLL